MIDETHENWTATIPCYCKEVYASNEFAPGHAIVINERAVEEHEWAVGEVFKDKSAVVAVIPSAPYELKVYRDKESSVLYIVRTPDDSISEDWELVRTIGASKTN